MARDRITDDDETKEMLTIKFCLFLANDDVSGCDKLNDDCGVLL